MYSAGGRAKSFQNRFKPPASKRRERNKKKKRRRWGRREDQCSESLRRGSGQWGFCQDRSVHMRLPVCTGGTAHSATAGQGGTSATGASDDEPSCPCHHLAVRERGGEELDAGGIIIMAPSCSCMHACVDPSKYSIRFRSAHAGGREWRHTTSQSQVMRRKMPDLTDQTSFRHWAGGRAWWRMGMGARG